MTEKTYTADEIKEMLAKSMTAFQKGMVSLIRECAVHREYRDLTGQQALRKVADKLEKLKE